MEGQGYQFHKQKLMEVTEAVSSLSSCLNVEQVAQTLTFQLNKLLHTDACAVAGWDASEAVLRLWKVCVSEKVEPGVCREKLRSMSACPNIREQTSEGRIAQVHKNDEYLNDMDFQFMQEHCVESMLLIPVHSKGFFYGMICILSQQRRSFNQQEIFLAQLLASQSSAVIENARSYQHLKRHADEVDAIHKVSLGLTGSLELKDVLNVILRSMLKLFSDAQDSHIFLYKNGVLEFGAAIWSDGRVGVAFSNPRPQGLTYTVARGGRLIIIPNTRNHSLFKNFRHDWSGSIIGMPLKIRDEVVGVISIAWDHPKEFKESEIRLLRLLGDQAALAIEKANLYEIISRQAHTDALTGLPNRRALDEQLEEELLRSSRYEHPFSFVMMDLNEFKQVNDTYGHPVGDQVLKQAGQFLREAIRDTDFIGRFGGDEFALIFPETNHSAVQKLIEKLQHRFFDHRFNLPDNQEISLTASFGVAVFPEDAVTVKEVIAVADGKLYEAKNKKSN